MKMEGGLSVNKEKAGYRGFGLIELLVVVAIIGLLTAIVLASLSTSRAKARFSQVIQELRQIEHAAQLDNLNNNNSWAPDAFPSVAPRFVPTFLGSWPVPPCAGWTYDWDNWGTTVRITVRNSNAPSTSANSVFYYCIESNVSTCSSGGPGGGMNILTYGPKTITCSE